MNTVEDFLTQDDTDMSVAMLAMVRNKFCFVIQPPKRWGKTEDGRDILFFGGIGGKLESTEGLMAALHREAKEEIGCDIKVISKANVCNLPIITKEHIDFKQTSATAQTLLPLCIFQNKRSEPGRKSTTNVFIYQTIIEDVEKMQPLDNPAIILLPPETLYQMENGMDMAQALREGAEIFSNIDLPVNAVLKPTPTPIAIIKLHNLYKGNLIN
ncbi:MAG: NUDIX domain-containing protein [Alphaproteobacteria bacterium]